MESRTLYVVMNLRDLEHSTGYVLCVGGADGSIVGGNP